jgi:amidase
MRAADQPSGPTHDIESGEPWRWSATRVAAAIRRKEISVREVTTSCLERIGVVNGTLNALVEVTRDEALEAAQVADSMVAAGVSLGPLHGVPVATKINSDQAGHATTNGIVALADDVAPADSPQIRRLRESGAILLGRSNAPAFSIRWFTENDLYGRTTNPWDATRTPGGSSGGAASAVASGMVAVGHGNDIGGSIRYPAYACGVVGLRPTVGLVAGYCGPRTGDQSLSMQTMAVQGPLARSVEDVRIALNAMVGYDPYDAGSIPGTPAARAPRRPRRIGVLRDGPAPLSRVSAQALDVAAAALADCGYEVEDVSLPLLEEAWRLWYLLAKEEFRRLTLPLVNDIGDAASRTVAAYDYAVIADWWGPEPTLEDYIRGYARRGTLIRDLQVLMEDMPVILLPISAEPQFEHDADIASVASRYRTMAALYSMMAISLVGFPALSLPTGVVDGLPSGVQLLGRRFDEARLLDTAQVIESRVGTFTPVDPIGTNRSA